MLGGGPLLQAPLGRFALGSHLGSQVGHFSGSVGVGCIFKVRGLTLEEAPPGAQEIGAPRDAPLPNNFVGKRVRIKLLMREKNRMTPTLKMTYA